MEDWVLGGMPACCLLVRAPIEQGGGAEDVEGRAPAGTSEWLSSAKVPSLWS